jgi:hypothetical protein
MPADALVLAEIDRMFPAPRIWRRFARGVKGLLYLAYHRRPST